MDDDGRPYDNHTFEELMKTVEKFKLKYDNPVMINSLVLESDEKLSFAIKETNQLKEIKKIAIDGIIEKEVNAFNGTLISKGLIKKIGYPNKDFFIKGDEVDYMMRANKENAFVATIVNSLYYHPSVKITKELKIANKKIKVYVESPWKEYYNMRNYTYMLNRDKQHKKIFVLGLKRIISILSCKCKKMETLKMLFKGYRDGKKEKLGATIKP